mgnify:CR=1 FL=1
MVGRKENLKCSSGGPVLILIRIMLGYFFSILSPSFPLLNLPVFLHILDGIYDYTGHVHKPYSPVFHLRTAWSERGEVASLHGVRYSGSSLVALCLLYRRYAKGYASHYARGFGEYSDTSNEEGTIIIVLLVYFISDSYSRLKVII